MPKSDKMIEPVKQFLANEGNTSKKINSYCIRYRSTFSNKQQPIDEYEEWKYVDVEYASIDNVSTCNDPVIVETYGAKNYKDYSY